MDAFFIILMIVGLMIVGPIIIFALVFRKDPHAPRDPELNTDVYGRNNYTDQIIREGYMFACGRLKDCGYPFDEDHLLEDTVAVESEKRISHLLYPTWYPGIRGDNGTLRNCFAKVESVTLYHALELYNAFPEYNQDFILDIMDKIVDEDVVCGIIDVGNRELMIALINQSIEG